MINFLTLKTKAFGLDFSDNAIKIINLKRKDGFLKLASWGKTELPPGIIEGREIVDEEKMAIMIKEAMAKIEGEKIRDKRVIVSLPEEKSFLEVIKMPKMEEQELISAIPFEAENYIPLPLNEAYLDFQTVPPVNGYSPDNLNILIGAISKDLVNSYVSCIKKAGLFPYAFEIESQAISRALIKNNISPRTILIIDFGKSRTDFIIFSGYSLRFTSSIPVSLDMLSGIVSKSLKIDYEEAQNLLLNYGLIPPSKIKRIVRGQELIPKKVFNLITPFLNDLTEQIQKYITYYKTHSEDIGREEKEISKVLLSGCGVNIRGLDDFLSSKLKIPVEFGNPWINIFPEPLKKLPVLSFKESLCYITALGLALRGIKEE